MSRRRLAVATVLLSLAMPAAAQAGEEQRPVTCVSVFHDGKAYTYCLKRTP